MKSFQKLCLAAYEINTFNTFNRRMRNSLVWSRASQGRHESGSISRFLLSVEERSQPFWGISFHTAQCGELRISCFNTTCYRGGWPNRYKKPQEMWLDCYPSRTAIEKTFSVWYPEHQAPRQLAERQKAIGSGAPCLEIDVVPVFVDGQ